ncbi:hypothetical protein HGRIS_004535 [Hohenbuehelia grisea]|uniref:Uncharacterized protein n=1 Tax=Hohenbuehelia grisea TaxID=104357 RepID=A0ABR3JC62_9AGAR
MPLLTTVLGFSTFGLAARFGQLGIQKRNPFDNLGGHVLSMVVFGYGGYWAYRLDQRTTTILAEKRAAIKERRRRQVADAEEHGTSALEAAS